MTQYWHKDFPHSTINKKAFVMCQQGYWKNAVKAWLRSNVMLMQHCIESTPTLTSSQHLSSEHSSLCVFLSVGQSYNSWTNCLPQAARDQKKNWILRHLLTWIQLLCCSFDLLNPTLNTYKTVTIFGAYTVKLSIPSLTVTILCIYTCSGDLSHSDVIFDLFFNFTCPQFMMI